MIWYYIKYNFIHFSLKSVLVSNRARCSAHHMKKIIFNLFLSAQGAISYSVGVHVPPGTTKLHSLLLLLGFEPEGHINGMLIKST